MVPVCDELRLEQVNMPSFNCHERWFFFFSWLSCSFEREREREKFIKREAEDDEIEKWGGGGLVYI